MAKIHNLLGMSMERAYDKTQCTDDIKPGDFLLVEDGIAMMDGAYPVMISGMSGVFHEYHTNTQEGRALRAEHELETLRRIRDFEHKQELQMIRVDAAQAIALREIQEVLNSLKKDEPIAGLI